jgi:8-oxo-dGTP pyrophosphatase MutT (NUDIX family)
MIVDEFDRVVGSAFRHEVLVSRQWRRTSGGILYDPVSSHILCHKRSSLKDERAGVWVATFGGKCSPREIPRVTAQRELGEEFGIQLEEVAFEFIDKFKSESRHQFEYLFTAAIFGSWKNVHVQLQHEVEAISWFPLSEIRDKLRCDADWYSYGYEEKLLTSIENNLL